MPLSHPLARVARFEAGQYRPMTFLQRGVAVPFTTPHLLGGRIRPGARGGAELVLGNPVGEDGVYVTPWSALPDICTPTLHDRALWGRIGRLGLLAPRSIREVARQVAAEGFAGRTAARAAEAAAAEDMQARTRTQYHLLLKLVRQGETGQEAGLAPEQDSMRGLEQRARAVLLALDPGDRISPIAAFEALAEVAEAFSTCGLPRNPAAAPMPRLVAEIGAVMQELTAWARTAAEPERGCVRLIGQSAELTLRCYGQALADAHAVLGKLPELLRQWRPGQASDPVSGPVSGQGGQAQGLGHPGRHHGIAALTTRPEWLLDGWGLICGLWRTADPTRRGLALLDMAAMVPVIPAEAGEWLGFDPSGDMETMRGGLGRWRRMVQPNQDWMTGRILDIIQRNEAMRAAAA